MTTKDKGAATTAAPTPEPPRPRFDWEVTSADSKAADVGHWRLRVAQSGGDGLWRPFVEYAGDGYGTEKAAEKALERLLR